MRQTWPCEEEGRKEGRKEGRNGGRAEGRKDGLAERRKDGCKGTLGMTDVVGRGGPPGSACSKIQHWPIATKQRFAIEGENSPQSDQIGESFSLLLYNASTVVFLLAQAPQEAWKDWACRRRTGEAARNSRASPSIEDSMLL